MTAVRPLRIGLVQMSMGEDTEANTARAVEGVRSAAAEGATLIVLPELFRSRYFCQTEDSGLFRLAESIPGPTTESFEALARELSVTIVVSLFERRAAGIYHNTSVLIDSAQGLSGMYRKMHIPDDPKYYEKFYFTPGDLGFRSFDSQAGRLGMLVCWDQWFPEAARLTALTGAEILIYPTAIGWHPAERQTHGDQQLDAWRTVQRSHAIANGCHVIAVNRTGFEPEPGTDSGIRFWGNSFVAAPDGRIVASADERSETALVCDIDLAAAESTRVNWPFLRDRRIDAYDGIVERYLDEPAGSARPRRGRT